MGMRETRERSHFSQKPTSYAGVFRKVGADGFDGDFLAFVVQVLGVVDFGHAAIADAPKQAILAENRLVDPHESCLQKSGVLEGWLRWIGPGASLSSIHFLSSACVCTQEANKPLRMRP